MKLNPPLAQKLKSFPPWPKFTKAIQSQSILFAGGGVGGPLCTRMPRTTPSQRASLPPPKNVPPPFTLEASLVENNLMMGDDAKNLNIHKLSNGRLASSSVKHN